MASLPSGPLVLCYLSCAASSRRRSTLKKWTWSCAACTARVSACSWCISCYRQRVFSKSRSVSSCAMCQFSVPVQMNFSVVAAVRAVLAGTGIDTRRFPNPGHDSRRSSCASDKSTIKLNMTPVTVTFHVTCNEGKFRYEVTGLLATCDERDGVRLGEVILTTEISTVQGAVLSVRTRSRKA